MAESLFDMFKEVEFKFIHNYSDDLIAIDFKIGTENIRDFISKQNMFYSDLERNTYFIYRNSYIKFGHFKYMDITVEENENI